MTHIPVPPQLSSFFARLGNHEMYPWKPLPWKGIYNKVLFFDPVTGATIELAKIEKGAVFPEHYHTTVQTLFLAKGKLRTGSGDIYEPGTFNVIPAGQLHGPFIGEEESIQYKYFSAVPVYLLKDGTTYIYQCDGTTISAGTLDFVPGIKELNFISSYKKE